MALVEDDLPGVSKVRGDFQLREDQGLAQRLQEQEYEEHFNSNVQLRRTARHDVSVAKEFQDEETQSFQQQEKIRLQHLREREERDREHAAEVTRNLEEEEQKLKEREEQDKEHAAKIAQKIKEEEDIQMALRMQDEAMAKKMQELEAKKRTQRLQQEEADGRLAHQASLGNQRSKGSSREGSLSDREVQRMKQLQLQGGASPPRSLDAATRQKRVQVPKVKTVTSSLPATMPATGPAPMLLPSYDQCIPDGYDWSAGGGGEEPVMDENERIALQEAEDERLAREMLQKEDDERKRGEQEDMEFARRMQKADKQPKSHDQDLEIARKLHEEEEARRKNLQSAHERDLEMAQRVHQEEKGRRGKQQRPQPQGAPPQHDADVELAMRLQREEVMKHKELKRQRLSQQKVMEQQRLEQQQQQRQQRQQPNGSASSRQPPAGQPPTSSRFAGYEVPPFSENEPPMPQGTPRSAPSMQQSREGDPIVPGQQGSPGHRQGLPPDGHPFNSAATSFYAYQPEMAGVQIPRGPKAPAASSQAKPSYKRNEKNEAGKKKKK